MDLKCDTLDVVILLKNLLHKSMTSFWKATFELKSMQIWCEQNFT
jgi:hypothetical protein